MYILKIITPQDDALTLNCANKSDILKIVESIENAQCACAYLIYTDEYEAIINSKKKEGGYGARLDKDTQTNNRKSNME